MQKRIAFIRGINVGGRSTVPMAELREALTTDGFEEVRTYIQSGNVVYAAPPGVKDSRRTLQAEGERIGEVIESRWGFAPAVMVRTADQVAAALARSPYGDADPAKAVLAFFDGDAPDLDALARDATAGEEWQLDDGVIHMHFPNGLGRSKFAARLTMTTVRNVRTVGAVLELARS
jgi:uncharacterized protein (DUF1697 family)